MRIGRGKTAFWKCKELFRRDININLKKRMLDCYVKSVMSYGCESWTYSKTIQNKIDAFQLWCYRRMLKIRYTDHVTSTRVKEIIGVERNWSEDLARRKLRYAGHIMRGSSGGLVQLVLEGYIEGKKGRGRLRRIWGDDIKEWSNCKTIGKAKRLSENKPSWQNVVRNFRIRRSDIDYHYFMRLKDLQISATDWVSSMS